MGKREIKVTIAIVAVFVIIIFLAFFIERDNEKIKLYKVKIVNKSKILLSDKEKDIMINDLINHLNKEYYYKCKKIVFYNNTYDKKSNKKYFYALVIGNDKSLIEITNLGNSKYKYSYIGNELTEDAKSKKTGVTYLQIVDPEEYEVGKKLEKEEDELKNGKITDAVPVE